MFQVKVEKFDINELPENLRELVIPNYCVGVYTSDKELLDRALINNYVFASQPVTTGILLIVKNGAFSGSPNPVERVALDIQATLQAVLDRRDNEHFLHSYRIYGTFRGVRPLTFDELQILHTIVLRLQRIGAIDGRTLIPVEDLEYVVGGLLNEAGGDGKFDALD